MRLISKIIVLSFIYYTNAFTYSNFYYNKNKLINNNNKFKNYRYKVKNIFCRFQNNISRRNILYLSPIILNPKPVMSKILEKNNNIKNVLVFGAGGYTGGDTIRNLIEKNINVIAVTRRPVKIVNRINANKDTLVIDDINKINKINSVIADVLKPETLKNIMKNVDAVIFCAASRPDE